MKWKLLALLEKSVLMIMSVKPLRWGIEALGNNKHLRNQKFIRRFWMTMALLQSLFILKDAWTHEVFSLVLGLLTLMVDLYCIHHKPNRRRRRDDNDTFEPIDPTPTGDKAEKWLHSLILSKK